MYIEPFWAGVLVTVIVEIIGLFIFAVMKQNDNKK